MSGASPVLEALDAPAHIGCVTLMVHRLDEVAGFYEKVIGLTVSTASAERVSLGTTDGTVLIRLVHAPDQPAAQARAPGLFHTAFLLPTRRDLANWMAHAHEFRVQIEGASDHLVSEAIYLSDPEGNGIEVYVDRKRADWPREAGMIKMATLPLDEASLVAERDVKASGWRFPAGGRVGHIHLKVGDLAAAEAFYVETLGLTVMARYPGASFMGWGGYHHHVAINVWQSRHAPRRENGTNGLAEFEIMLDTRRTPARPVTAGEDPSGNRFTIGSQPAEGIS